MLYFSLPTLILSPICIFSGPLLPDETSTVPPVATEERNLVDQGTYVILAGFALSFVKAALEKLVPALLSYGRLGLNGGGFVWRRKPVVTEFHGDSSKKNWCHGIWNI